MSLPMASGAAPSHAIRTDRRTFVYLLAASGLGVLVGLFLGEGVAPLRVVGEGFIRLLQVTVLPYLLGSILAGLGSRTSADARRLAIRGGLVLAAFWVMGLMLMAVSSLAYPARPSGDSFFSVEAPATSDIDWLSLYIPSNLFNSLSNNVLPAVVLFGLFAGTALGGMEGRRKITLLDAIEAFNETMSRVARSLIRITPVGVFAIAATTAGLMRAEQLIRLQLWFVVYISLACIVSFWVLPGLVAILTPIPYRAFLVRLRSALLTAFAAGDLFIVLPLITEEGKALLKERGVPAAEADATMGVIVPLLFNFPHLGKILSLGFLPFAAWFSGGSLSIEQWGTLASAGVLTMFGSLNGAIPFLLDALRLPADLFGLFSMSAVLNSRFGTLVAAVHTAALSLVIAVSLTGRLRIQVARLMWFTAASAVIVASFVGGTRAVFTIALPVPSAGLGSLEALRIRPPLTSSVMKGRAQAPRVPPTMGRRLTDILERRVLRVGYFPDSVPYAFVNDKEELVGYDIEMAHSLARDLNATLEFVETTREQADEALTSGACDIIMSGVVVDVTRARRMALSHTYQQGRLGFLVLDHERGRYRDLEALRADPLMIGIPALDDVAPLIRQHLTASTFVRFASIDELVAALSGSIDAAVLPMERASYLSRIDPRLAAVLPDQSTSSVALAYAMPAGELEFRNVVDAWIDLKVAQGALDNARAYWVRGEGLRAQQPRWSIARNVLGWGR